MRPPQFQRSDQQGENVMNMIPPPLLGATIDGTQSELLRALARSLNAEQAFWISG